MKLARLAALAALPLQADGSAPKEFRILRAGLNKTEKGDFLFDETAAKQVMAAYTAKGLDKIQIDYEHQSMMPPPGGGPAQKPAAGWFKPEVRGGELWATDVAWTARALSMLAPAQGAPEYRYISPVLYFDEESRRVSRIKNLALTNDPALDELSPLVAATAQEDHAMPCAECSAKDAKIKDLEEKYTALSARLSAFEKKKDTDGDADDKAAMTALTGIRAELCALTGQSTEVAALGALKGLKAAHDELTQLKTKIEAEKLEKLTADFKAKLDEVQAAGGVTPAGETEIRHRGYWEKQAKREGLEKTLEQLTAAAPILKGAPIVKPNGKGGPTEPEAGTAILTAADVAVAKMMGHDLKEVEAFKKKQLEDRARSALLVAP